MGRHITEYTRLARLHTSAIGRHGEWVDDLLGEVLGDD